MMDADFAMIGFRLVGWCLLVGGWAAGGMCSLTGML